MADTAPEDSAQDTEQATEAEIDSLLRRAGEMATRGASEPAPLPRYFDKLDLTAEQADKVRRVAATYDPKIAELQRRLQLVKGRPNLSGVTIGLVRALKKLLVGRQQELEEVLTDEQRARLQELRERK
jgi:hypothetical protein